MNPDFALWGKMRARATLTVVILCLGLLLSALGASELLRGTQTDAHSEFSRMSNRITTAVILRLSAPVFALSGARGTHAASESLDRGEFKAYVDSMDMPGEFPGSRGMGFVDRVQRADLPTYVRRANAGDSPGLVLRAFGDAPQDTVYLVRYAEPEILNNDTMGIDLGSNPRTREAIEQAVASGRATLSPAVPLLNDGLPSPGFLLFLPVYRGGAVPDSVPERQAQLAGLLFAPLVARDVLTGIMGVTEDMVTFQLHVGHQTPTLASWIAGVHQIDGGEGITRTLEPRLLQRAAFGEELRFEVHGQTFTLQTSSTRAFERRVNALPAYLVLGVGTLLTLALAWMAAQAARAQRRTEERARVLRVDHERLAAVARRTSNAVVITDVSRRITWVNDGFERVTGYSRDEVLGRKPGDFLQFEGTDVRELARMRVALGALQPYQGELLNRGKTGRIYWIELEIQPLKSERGEFMGFMAMENDVTERVHSAAALRSSQAFLDRTGRVGGIGGWEMDLVNQQLRWTDQTCRIHDEPPGLLPTPREAVSYFTPEAKPVIRAALRQVIETGQAFDLELPLVTATGRAIWVRIVGELELRDGVAHRLVGALQDVTVRKQLSEAMERTNGLLTQVIESLPCALSVMDGDGRLVVANTDFGRLFGLPAHLREPGVSRFEDIVRFSAERGDFGPGDVEEQVRGVVHSALNHAPGMRHERVLTTGEVVELRRGPLGQGGFVSTYTDISAQREAEAQARRSTELMSNALEVTGAGLVIFDPSDRLVFCNDRYRELYREIAHLLKPGVTFEETVRASLALYEPPAAQGRHDAWVAERVQDHRKGGDWERRIPGGRTLRVVERVMPDGHVVSFRIDITDLVRATEAAQAASHSKSQFLANMSHEIRTPMNAILGMLALLQRTPLSPRQRDYADKTESAARSLLGLLNDILDFSKVEAGKLVLDPHPFGVDQLMRELAVMLSASVGDKEIEVLFDIDPLVPAVLFGDDLRLRQVLVNLAGNAIKFTHFGEVVIALKSRRSGAGQILLEIAVRDTGIGIAPENQARIFEGFTQAEATTTRRFGGTGLGLVICQRLVALMGGELKLQSQLGRGTEFSFSIVLGVPRTAAEHAPRLPAPPALDVLIVDDNELARDTLASMAQANGWRVETAASGEAAIESLTRAHALGRRFDAVFMDWHMPGLDGWAAARRIKSPPLNAALDLLIMVTAHGRELLESRDLSEKDLLDAYLIKPVTGSMLLDAVKTARDQRQGVSEPLFAHPTEQGLRDLRILLVEDNETNQQVASELLVGEGARVSVAGNGRIAVDLLAADSSAFDVVLMDVQMPVMDGFTATRCIRNELGLRALPVIAMTANAMAGDREACLQAGMNDHVGKPFDLDQLVQTLQRHAERAGTVAPAAGAPRAGAVLPQAILALASAQRVDLVNALQRLGGSVKAYARFLARFIQEHPGQMAELQASLDAGDFKSGARVAHTLKGLAGTLGITPLVELGFKAEQALAAARTVEQVQAPVQLLTAFRLDGVSALQAALQAAQEAPVLPVPIGSTGCGLRGRHILLVDDSEINLDVSSHQLERLGATVLRSSSGAQALDELRRGPQRFDAVLMDVQMPEMDGLETTRRIRSELGLSRLPVIALSAGSQASDRDEALAAGANDYLNKRAEPGQLQQMLLIHLGSESAGAGAEPALAAPVSVADPVACSAWAGVDGLDHRTALARLGGDQALFESALRRMLVEFGVWASRPAPAGLLPAERAALAAQLHKLRGIAGTVEAQRVHAAAGALETLMRSTAPDDTLPGLWTTLATAIADLDGATQALRTVPEPAAADMSGAPLIGETALNALREMLLSQDLDALAAFAAHRAGLTQRLGAGAVARMGELLDVLEFEQAAALIEPA